MKPLAASCASLEAIRNFFFILFFYCCLCFADEELLPLLPEGFASEVDGISVSCGSHHTCALEYRPGIEFGGVIKCWGMALEHQFDKQHVTPEGTFIQISTGDLHSCAISIDETVQCWGAVKYAPPGEFIQVSVGEFHSCGLRKDQTVVCWGKNIHGEGHPPHGKFVQVSCARTYSCGLRPTGRAECWGMMEAAPGARPPADALFRQLSVGDDHGCGLTLAGGVRCWGSDRLGQARALAPTDPAPGDGVNQSFGPFKQISASRGNTCAICADERLKCWGQAVPMDPARHPAGAAYDQLSLGRHHVCAVTMDSELHCWGQIQDVVDIPDGFMVG